MNKGAGGCYRIYHLPLFYWVFSNRVLCTRIHGSTVLLAPIKALPCLCIFPPMADDVGAFAFGQFIQQPYHNEFIPVF
jgi:hypothetical protein